MPIDVERTARNFRDAFRNLVWPNDDGPRVEGMTLDEAYHVQDRVCEMRCAEGESVAGWKVGCTSSPIRAQFGLTEPILGRLMHPHVVDGPAVVDPTRFANCAIEPEMVLRIDRDLRGQNLPDDVLRDAIESVSPGIELHHFRFWHQPPTLAELVCSGGIHAGLVVGDERVAPDQLAFGPEVFRVFVDDELVTAGPASEIMGGPLASLRWLVGRLTDRGDGLPAGSLVIPGSPVELVTIERDCELRIAIDGVGEVSTTFRS